VIRAAVLLLVLVTAVLLQTALFPHLSIAGFRPDLVLLVTVALALRDGPQTGTAVGFAGGVLSDLLLIETTAGVYTIILVVTGYLAGSLRQHIPPRAVLAPLGVVLASGIAATAAHGVLARLLGDPRFTLELVTGSSLLVGLYNTLLAPPVLLGVFALSSRFRPHRAVAQ
jgi:rod shape-determining protein MreD